MEGEGGIEAEIEEEVVHNIAPSLLHVALPPPYNILESQLWHVTLLMEQMEKNLHDDRNEVISFMNDLYHNQWNIKNLSASLLQVRGDCPSECNAWMGGQFI